MRVVGIDQSYTGFGYSVDGEAKKKAFPISKFPGEIERLDVVRDWFYDWLHEQLPVHLLVMEGYANHAKFGREQAGELGGVVKLAAFDLLGSGKILVVPPTSLKKFVSGSGGAKKNTMLMHVYKKWGQQFSDDNQADAFALEMFGLAYIDIERGTGGYHKYEIEAVEAVRKAQ